MVLPSNKDAPQSADYKEKENSRSKTSNSREDKHSGRKLQRTYSWPPSISVIGEQYLPKLSSEGAEFLPIEEPIEKLSKVEAEKRLVSSSALSLKSSVSGHSSASSAPSAAEKAKGFRASVSKRWVQFVRKSQLLNKIAEKAERRHHGHAKKNGKAAEVPDIYNSPHELSYAYMDEAQEPERGRTPIFTSTGQLQIQGGEPRVSRKCRTTSGRRHAWIEPSIGMFTVQEEQRSIDEREKMQPAAPKRNRAMSKSTV